MMIIGNLEIVDRSFPRDETVMRRALERARASADRANALTQRLLAFSRRQPLDAKLVQVGELISSMADAWAKYSAARAFRPPLEDPAPPNNSTCWLRRGHTANSCLGGVAKTAPPLFTIPWRPVAPPW
jgi:signal transduction histidine kinase